MFPILLRKFVSYTIPSKPPFKYLALAADARRVQNTEAPFDEDKLCGTVMAENRLETPSSCISKRSQRSNLLRFQTVASSRLYVWLNNSSLLLIEINDAGPPLEHFVRVNDVSHSCVTKQQQLRRCGKTTENLHPFFRIFHGRAKRNYADIQFG